MGLVGDLGIKENILDLFSLSCRALGRGIEEKMLDFLSNKYEIKEIEFWTSSKNEDLKLMWFKIFPNAKLTNF